MKTVWNGHYKRQKLMKDRITAFLIHLAISSVIAVIAVIIVYFVWYPAPLHDAVGVTKVFLMLLAIDITLGPVLTLIIYKRDKPSLRFDLTVIAAIQLAALCYGMFNVFEGRPAFVVYNKDRFDISRAMDIDPNSAAKARKDGNQSAAISWFSPRWVAAVASKDNERQLEIDMSSMAGGPDWPQFPELFVPLAKDKAQMFKYAKPLQALRDLHGKNDQLSVLDNWQDSHVKWLPLRGTVKDMVVLIDADSAEVVEVIDIEPWP
jgi:hypothetical protein